MWRTLLHKQVGLVRSSSASGYSTSRLFSVPVTGHESSDGALRSNTKDSQHTINRHENIAKAQSTVVGLFLKLHHGVNSKSIERFLKHINKQIALVQESRNTDLTICIPSRAGGNGKESSFGFKNVFVDFEKWCYGVVVVSSLISWHRLLFKDEREEDNKTLNILKIYDFLNVNQPLHVLPVNGPAKPVDSFDAARVSLESIVDQSTALAENAVAMRFLKLRLHEKALKLFLSASAKGNVAAHFNSGLCYEKGLGTTQDISKAVSFYKFAASHGHLKATFNLGLILLQGKESEGLEMMEKAAKENSVKAQSFLGLYYADDKEHHDMEKSVYWLQMASKQNDAKAQYQLGVRYEKGINLPRNMKKAMEMYHCASENGHAGAQHNYAVFHEYGLGGLCVDKHEALRWYEIAAGNGNENAKKSLELLQKEIGPPQKSQNLRERLDSNIWIPKQPRTSAGHIPRCSSSPDRLFSKSDLDDCDSEQRSEPKSITHKDTKCVWVI